MKKFAAVLFAGALAALSLGSPAAAYPLFERLVTVDKPTVEPGETVTATANCVGLEEVTFDLGGVTATGACNGTDDDGNTSAALVTDGTASAALVAPSATGSFTVTASGSFSGDLGSTQVVVAESPTIVLSASPTDSVPPSGGLPATGSGGIGWLTSAALGLVLVGIGLFAVATLRRNQPAGA